jgi:hypothetical protein
MQQNLPLLTSRIATQRVGERRHDNPSLRE